MDRFFIWQNDFQPYDLSHITVLALLLVILTISVYVARHADRATVQGIGKVLALIPTGILLLCLVISLLRAEFDINTDLPLALCNVSALLVPLLAFRYTYAIYEILLFWIMAGTIQAVLTPDLAEGFPHYRFFRYWGVHAGLVIYILYATIGQGYRPRFKSILVSFLAAQVLFVISIVINLILGTNYNYLCHKPTNPTLLDYLGPWPIYVLAGQLLILPFFMLVFLPFYATGYYDKKKPTQ